MVRQLVPRSIKREFKKITQQLLLDLSQPLVIVQESNMFVDCPNCIWDSINKKSSNVFDASFVASDTIFLNTDQQRTISPASFTSGRCPICLGEGQLFTNKEVCIPAMINYMSAADRGGKYVELAAGKEGINFMIIKTLACHYELLTNNTIFVVHNNIKCEKFAPPFLRGLGGDEAVCEMVLQTSEVGERTSGKLGGGDPLSRDDDPRRRVSAPADLSVARGDFKGR